MACALIFHEKHASHRFFEKKPTVSASCVYLLYNVHVTHNSKCTPCSWCVFGYFWFLTLVFLNLATRSALGWHGNRGTLVLKPVVEVNIPCTNLTSSMHFTVAIFAKLEFRNSFADAVGLLRGGSAVRRVHGCVRHERRRLFGAGHLCGKLCQWRLFFWIVSVSGWIFRTLLSES